MLRITRPGVNRVFNFFFGNGWRIDDAAVAFCDAGDLIQWGHAFRRKAFSMMSGTFMLLMRYFITNLISYI